MKKKTWDAKACGCVKTSTLGGIKVVIRCDRHLGKPSKKRLVCHFEDGMVRRG